MKKKRGHVWLAAAGIVLNDAGDWLVVKKKYGGLQGQWSLPAGFVQRGETADEAVIREVEEETGIQAEVIGLIGLRTGVIDDEISDNMMIFLLKALSKKMVIQQDELWTAAFLSKESLLSDSSASTLLQHLLKAWPLSYFHFHNGLDPGEPFGYTKYHVYFKNSKN
ncbi:NUDIX hydrolase [Anoxybacillus sp. UARK-01]|uniref:NUDIX hydrolase n=1 Tax=Anoxybacteroides rupiense TaxID=311460 RepID=A0ABD5IZM7_9BACL|nr:MULTISPECIES: NUDIX hydrolase [Anoxybacillus]MED5053244.1 NUDIX hydrolase [Anoxybacillus rupiensis]OQM44626.1 NUDIX hydrolase [Anoxybacillus sp. UARK-01]